MPMASRRRSEKIDRRAGGQRREGRGLRAAGGVLEPGSVQKVRWVKLGTPSENQRQRAGAAGDPGTGGKRE